MRISSKSRLYAALCYADIFDYPLTRLECREFSLFETTRIHKLPAGVMIKKVKDQIYYYLSGREAIVSTRLRRASYAKEKWRKAIIVSKALCSIPTVALVGVTGGLAMENAKIDDDIDLYCVTENGTLWITRLLVTVFVSLMGVRRTPRAKDVKDTFCLNMFTTIGSMRIPKDERDVFSAHEVVQMVPLWEKGGVYRQFLRDNRWAKTYLPNAWKELVKKRKRVNSEQKIEKIKVNHRRVLFTMYYLLFIFLEPLARILQIWYMKNSRTNEVITSDVIRFHPHDARVWIKEKLDKRLKLFNIPLDTIFYHR